ncbi:ribbon-helix-helix domain-containing protein [Hydrogenimonas sp.]
MSTVKKMISMEEGIARELEQVAKVLGKTQREVVESALDFYFDYTDGIIADDISRKIETGEMKTYDADEVEKMLGIEG